MTRFALLAVFMACGKSGSDKPAPAPKPETTAQAPAAPADAATPTPSPYAALDLPGNGINAAGVVGHALKDVNAALGEPNTDGEYDVAGSGAKVYFNKGVAVGIEIFGSKTGLSDDEKLVARKWFGIADGETKLNGQPFEIGDSVDGMCLALYVTSAIPAIKREAKKQDAEWQSSDTVKNMERAEVEGATNGILRTMGIAGLAHADGTTLEVRAAIEFCDKGVLRSVKSELLAKKLTVDKLFNRMRCKSANTFGEEISW